MAAPRVARGFTLGTTGLRRLGSTQTPAWGMRRAAALPVALRPGRLLPRNMCGPAAVGQKSQAEIDAAREAKKAAKEAKKAAARAKEKAGGKAGGAASAGGQKKKKEESVYSKTVNLPETTFNQRANSKVREPELHEFWATEKIYERLYQENTGTKFVLHDGPPYANGDLHIGHALNKILKDFINRYQIMRGKKVRFVPGWDCHGMPIELKVLQTMKGEEKKQMTPLSLRKKAAQFATETVAAQRESFKRYGVWADWDEPYLTLSPEYEAAQIEAFGAMVKGGHIYRGRKPVNWSPSSRTALAEAELEYPEGHVSTSMYASFEVTAASEGLQPFAEGLRVAVSTSTPCSIPIYMDMSMYVCIYLSISISISIYLSIYIYIYIYLFH